MKHFLLFFFLFCVCPFSRAADELTLKRKVYQIEPSAEAMAQIKSIITPFGLSNGVPEISIPLYSSPEDFINLRLVYHGGGIKVMEKASTVGLGWSLEGGGLITRIVRGLPDDSPNGFLYMSENYVTLENKEINQLTTYDEVGPLISAIETNSADPSNDIFFFKFYGYQGKFFIDRNKGAHTIDKSNLKFDIVFDSNNKISEFAVTTPEGIIFIFNEKETALLNPAINGIANFTSTWFLKEVKTNQSVLVTYEYLTATCSNERIVTEYKYPDVSNTLIGSTDSYVISFNTVFLDKIVWGKGRITFTEHTVTDLAIPAYVIGMNISLFDKIGSTSLINFCEYEFNYKKFGSEQSPDYDTDRDLRLDNIKETKSSVTRTTSFVYSAGTIPAETSKQQDLWGYYNSNGSTTLIPMVYSIGDSLLSYLPFPGATIIPGANREVNDTFLFAGQLKKIIYPSNRIEEYTFEPNRFNFNNTEIRGGGLRIREIKTYPASDPTKHTTITYYYSKGSKVGPSSGKLNYIPSGIIRLKNNPFAESLDNFSKLKYSTCYYANNFVSGDMAIPAVFYDEVFLDYGEDGYSRYLFDKPLNYKTYINDNLLPGFLPSNDKANYKKTLNKTSISSDKKRYWFFNVEQMFFPYPNNSLYDWSNDYLIQEDMFTNDDIIKKRTAYSYSLPEISTKVHSYGVLPGYSFANQIAVVPGNTFISVNGDENNYQKYYYISAWKSLVSIKEYLFNDNGDSILSRDDEFEYTSNDSSKWRFVKNKILNINGRRIIKNYSYPFENKYFKISNASLIETLNKDLINCLGDGTGLYTVIDGEYVPVDYIVSDNTSCYNSYEYAVANCVSPEVNALIAMVNNNQVSNVIESVTLIEENGVKYVTEASFNLYNVLKNGRIGLKANYILNKTPLTENAFTYSHSSLNSSTNKVEFSYCSDYQPIMIIDKFNDKGYPVEMHYADNIPISKIYSESGQLLIEGYNLLYNNTINKTASFLRSNYPDAMITSYEYHPFFGKVRETDFRGRTTYFVYDLSGEIVAIKDHEHNIVKAIVKNDGIYGKFPVDRSTDPDYNSYANLLDISIEGPILEVPETIEIYQKIQPVISNFNRQLSYIINYGDGQEETYNFLDLEHKYNNAGTYTINLACKSNGATIYQENHSIIVHDGPTPLTLTTRYNYDNLTNKTTFPYNPNNYLGIIITPKYGKGYYTATWEVSCLECSQISQTTTQVCYYGENLSNLFIEPGTYDVTCTITDGRETKNLSWSFQIGSGSGGGLLPE